MPNSRPTNRNPRSSGRVGEGMQPPETPDGVLYFMGIFEFADELVHFAHRETADGQRWHFEGTVVPRIDSAAAPIPIVSVEHDLRFREDFRILCEGTFRAHGADGRIREFAVTALKDFWPGLAGYDNYRGYASGLWRGRTTATASPSTCPIPTSCAG